MPWTDQCKFAFKANADGLLGKQKKKNVTLVLRDLAKQSDIPFNTLKRWWYEKEQQKKSIISDTNDTTIENNTISKSDSPPSPPLSRICIRCNRNKVELITATKKPLSKTSEHFGLCSKCRKEQTNIKKLDTQNNLNDGLMTICPSCNHVHYISKERLEDAIKKYLTKKRKTK